MGGCLSKPQPHRKFQPPTTDKANKNRVVDQDSAVCFDNEIIIQNANLFCLQREDILASPYYSSIVSLVCPTNSSNFMYGTGILLSRNIILTVAHSIFSLSYGREFNKNQYRVYFGSDGSKYYQVEDWSYQKQFFNAPGKQLQFDYALIKLKDRSLPNHNNKFLQLSLPCKCIINKDPQAELYIFGYPHYKNNHSPADPSASKINLKLYGLQKRNATTEIKPKIFRIDYQVSTQRGQSGCPVVYDNKIIAIHKARQSIKQCNIGRLVTKDLIANIEKWCLELKGDPIQISKSERCSKCNNSLNGGRTIDLANQLDQKTINNEALFEVQQQQISRSPLYSTIAAFQIKLPRTTNLTFGSGILLSRNIILTAAHNVYNKRYEDDYDLKDFRVFLGSDGLRYYQVEDWRYELKFRKAKNDQPQLDYALIKLKNVPTLPNHYNDFLQLSLPCQCILNKKSQVEISVYGYPLYKNNYNPRDPTGETRYLSLYGLQKKNVINEVQPQQFFIDYAISTEGGQSGCPIVYQNKIIAIHKGGRSSKQCNVGRLVTKDLIANVQKWLMQLKEDPIKIDRSQRCPNCIPKQKIKATEQLRLKAAQDQNDPKIKAISEVKMGRNHQNEQEKGTESVEAADELHKKGMDHYDNHNLERALECYSLALSTYERVKGKGCFQSAKTFNNMGSVYQNQQDLGKALECYILALSIKERVKGKGCFQSADTLNNMGNAYQYQQELGKALECYILALSTYERVKGKGCFQSAGTLNNMGNVYNNQQDLGKALECYILALQIFERVKGKGCFQSADTLNNMGNVYNNQQDLGKALECYILALQIFERVKGKGCFQSANTLNNMGSVYQNQQNLKKALECYILALSIKERVKGKGCFQSAGTLKNMGSAYQNQQELGKALECYKQSLSIYEKFNFKGREYGGTLFNMGLLYIKLNDIKAAASAFQSSLKVYEGLSIQQMVEGAAFGLAKCLKALNQSSKLKIVTAKYGLENRI